MPIVVIKYLLKNFLFYLYKYIDIVSDNEDKR